MALIGKCIVHMFSGNELRDEVTSLHVTYLRSRLCNRQPPPPLFLYKPAGASLTCPHMNSNSVLSFLESLLYVGGNSHRGHVVHEVNKSFMYVVFFAHKTLVFREYLTCVQIS